MITIDKDVINKIARTSVEEAMQFLVAAARKELKDQGHKNTGKLDRSFEIRVQSLSDDVIRGQILHEDYVDSLDTGIPQNKVPFSLPGTGSSSKYISGLIDFFKSKNLSAKEAKRRAFATAIKAKYRPGTGHPTRPYFGGKKYSKNGRRTGWKDHAWSEENIEKFESLIKFAFLLEEIVDGIVDRTNKAA